MKRLLTGLLVSISILSFNCKESNHVDHSMHEMPFTKIKKSNGIKFVFDMATMKDHMKMMQKMNIEMPHEDNVTHVLTLTMMKEGTTDVLKGLPLKLKVQGAVEDPGEKTVKEMSGGNMYHQIAELKISGKGEVKVIATVDYDNKSITETAVFTF